MLIIEEKSSEWNGFVFNPGDPVFCLTNSYSRYSVKYGIYLGMYKTRAVISETKKLNVFRHIETGEVYDFAASLKLNPFPSFGTSPDWPERYGAYMVRKAELERDYEWKLEHKAVTVLLTANRLYPINVEMLNIIGK